jgi:hypothetical protein
MTDVFHNWSMLHRLMNKGAKLEGFQMETLESLKDAVKDWIDSVPLIVYGHLMQLKMLEEVTS